MTTMSSSSAAIRTAEEIWQRGHEKYLEDRSHLFSCHRCGRSLTSHSIPLESYVRYHDRRYLKLTLPPEEGKVKPKEYNFLMCQWCTTAFLKFMQEKSK